MKCIVMPEPGKVIVDHIAEPEVKKEDVLIKIHNIGLCGTDLHSFRGQSVLTNYPLVPGHEVGGEIVLIGKDVPNSFKTGERVTVKPYFNCAECYPCSIDRINCCENSKTLGVQIPGALCEYISLSYKNVIRCQDMSFEEMALIEPLAVGCHLSNRTGVKAGETVLVYGCGVIGLGVIAAAYLKGASVIAVDIVDEKLQMAKAFGAKYTVNSLKQDINKEVYNITSSMGVHVAMEAIGFGKTMAKAVDLVTFAGRIGFVGYGTGELGVNSNLIVKKELGIYGSRNAKQEEFAEVISHIRSKELPYHRMVTETFDMMDSAKAFECWDKDTNYYTKIQITIK